MVSSSIKLWFFIALRTLLSAQVNGSAVGFVRVKRNQFVLNGALFLFNGFNSYWMMNVAVDPNERCKITEVFREAAAAGLSVCRTWAFSDGGRQALQISPGVYDERVFQALDFVIAEASQYGIRLILSLSNNYNDFGGTSQYTQWARNAGIAINSDDDFYANPVVKGYYKNYVKTVLTRYNTVTKMAYRDDPIIMAWELMNEPRCQTDYSGRTVTDWVQEMAIYTKSLDKKHMLEIGMEGFYGDLMPKKKQYNPGYEVGTDFIDSYLIPEIDFATIHAYTDQWLSGQSDGVQSAFVQQWLWNHWNDAKSIIKKPMVFAEFGKSNKYQGYTISGRDWFYNNIYRNIFRFARNGGSIGGGLVWQVMAEGMENYYDGYEIVLSSDPSIKELISRRSHSMSSLAHTLSMQSSAAGGHGEAARGVNRHMRHSQTRRGARKHHKRGKHHKKGKGHGNHHHHHHSLTQRQPSPSPSQTPSHTPVRNSDNGAQGFQSLNFAFGKKCVNISSVLQ